MDGIVRLNLHPVWKKAVVYWPYRFEGKNPWVSETDSVNVAKDKSGRNLVRNAGWDRRVFVP